jgi:hypothetical protein
MLKGLKVYAPVIFLEISHIHLVTYQPINLSTFPGGKGTLNRPGKQAKRIINTNVTGAE